MRDRRLIVLAAASLPLLAAAVYHNGMTGEFVLDDVTLLQDMRCADEPVQSLRGLLLLGGGPCAYRPLRHLSYALDRALFGQDPVGYHIMNLALHMLTVLAVFLLARRLLRAGGLFGASRLTAPRTPADPRGEAAPEELRAGGPRTALFGPWVAAALFAVHPVHVDAVTYISGRRDLLTTLLFLACVLAHLRYRETGRRIWAALIPPLFYLALQAKEMAITLPVVLLLLDAVFDRTGGLFGASRLTAPRPPADPRGKASDRTGDARASPGRRVLAAVSAPWRAVRRRPLLHGTVALVAAAYFVGRGIVAPMTHHPDLWGGSRLANTATALGTLPKYVQLLAFPRTLMADYSPDAYPIQTTPLAPLPLSGIAIVLAIVIGAAATARRSPAASLGIAWFGIALLPVMHVIPHHELMAEHYLYLPSVGAFIAAGAGLMRLRRWSPVVAAAIAALALVPLGMRTLVRNFDWRDARTLWEAQLAATDDCARAHYNHSTVILDEGGDDPEELRRAERHLRRAYEIQAATRAGVSRVPGNEIVARLGSIAVRLGRTEEGLPMLRAALAREMRGPPGPETAETLRNVVVTFLNAGGAGTDERGRALLIEALPALDRWVEIAPAEVEVRRMRGRTRHLLCDTAGARADYAAMVRLGAPGASPEGWEMTVESLLEEGDVGGARRAIEAAGAAGVRSPRLDAFLAAIDSGAPPPPPRCPPTRGPSR